MGGHSSRVVGWVLAAASACGSPSPPADTTTSALATSGGDDTGAVASSTDPRGDDSSTSTTSTTSTTGAFESTTTTGGDLACSLSGQPGTCIDVTTCPASSLSVLGTCEDVPAIQCCLPDAVSCSVDAAPGLCLPSAQCPPGLERTAGLCPGDADVQCCTDPSRACDPDAAPTPNDGLAEVSWDPACPAGMIPIDDFCIDRHEASLVVLDGDGAVIGSHSPYAHPTGDVRAVSLEGAVPQGYIDGDTAAAACAAAGKRLCDDDEWLRACRGAAGHVYPYGDALEPGTCNDARAQHPAVEYFGTNDPSIWSQLGNPCILQVPDGVQTTGAHVGCVSDDGAFDMVGNLHEWTADPAGTFRGGFFVDTALNGPGCTYATTAHDRSHWDYSTGFRCCAAPL